MNREVQIKIIDPATSAIIGELDLTNFDDFPLVLNKGVSDIADIQKRKGTFSLNFKIPATPNNNSLLGHLNIINVKEKDQLLSKKSCVVFIDNIETETGFLRVFTSNSKEFYNAVFFGDNTDWVSDVTDLGLNQLDWRDSGLLDYTVASIGAVNADTVDNRDYNWAFIDRNVPFSSIYLRPSLYVKAIIEALFRTVGYTVESNWLDDADVKKLMIDPACIFEFDQDTIEATEIEYLSPAPPDIDTYIIGNTSVPATPSIRSQYRFPGAFTTQVKDQGSLFTVGTTEYDIAVGGLYTVAFDCIPNMYRNEVNSWDLTVQTTNIGTRGMPSIRLYLVLNNTLDDTIDGTIIHTTIAQRSIASSPIGLLTAVPLQQGDKLTIFAEILDDAFGWNTMNLPQLNSKTDPVSPGDGLDRWKMVLGQNSRFKVIRNGTINIGDQFTLNGVIPSEINAIDILQDIKSCFNLYFLTDTFRRAVTIEPRDDFYEDISTADDWSDIIDLSKGYTIDYKSNYLRDLDFAYAPDDKDGYMDRYNVINNRIYAKYTQFLGDRFDKGTSVLSTKILAPTIQGETQNNSVTSVIREEWGDLALTGTPFTEYKPRLLNFVRGVQVDEAGVQRLPATMSVGISESFGGVIAPINLSFGGVDGLFANYWARTISNLTEGGVLTIYVNMSLNRFRELKLQRLVYIDAPSEIKGYYIVQAVKNFDAVKDQLTKVELLRFEAYEPATIDTTQLTNNTATVTTTLINGNTPEPIYVEETINGTPYLIEVWAENNGNILPVYKE